MGAPVSLQPGSPSQRNAERSGESVDLAAVPLFAGMSRRELHRVSRLGRLGSFAAGARVIGADEIGDTFYIVLEGTVRVSGYGKGHVDLRSGDFFGELVLLDGKARLRSVHALTPVRLVQFDPSAFRQLLELDGGVAARNMVVEMARRLRRLTGEPFW